MTQAAHIVEVFSSIQGEGQYVGYRQVFVRFVGCNLTCEYCDTPESRKTVAMAQIETTPGKRDFEILANPLSIAYLAECINNLLVLPHHSISITGGEPLCQSQAIKELAPLLKGNIHLETNGTLAKELAMVLPYLDMISMDIKLPSASGQEVWEEHREFLALANTKRVFVKVVVSSQTSTEEFQQALEMIADINPQIPLIIQPITPMEPCDGVTPEQVLALQEQALTLLSDVRVIPQTHKFMGQL